MEQVDLIIRNGTIVDGTGAEPFRADIAIRDDRIAAIEPVDHRAGHAPVGDHSSTRDIDASGRLVTPGFIDPHSHLDGHASWEHRLKPDSGHGITTTVFGNCGVGFAPCAPEHRRFTVALMEGVEDIPAEVLDEGLPWAWETYPEYLSFLAERTFDMNVAGLLPHSLVRVHVMGKRAIEGEPATAADIKAIARLTEEALAAGAVGVGSTRVVAQRTLSGIPSPSQHAEEGEYLAIAQAIAAVGHGVLQIAPEFKQFPRAEHELAMIIRVCAETGVPVVYSLKQANADPDGWRRLLDMTAAANAEGLPIHPMVLGRPTGAIAGWETSSHRFSRCPSYRQIAHLPLQARVEFLARPEVRAAILSEEAAGETDRFATMDHLTFPMGAVPDYEPGPESSIASVAERTGGAAAALTYDTFMARDGRGMLFVASGNYSDGSLEPAREMMQFEGSVLGLGDGGAHSTLICDASATTSTLSFWTRDRTRGERLTVPEVVHKLTAEPARLFGFADRGELAPGRKADLNIVDYERLGLSAPRMDYDLPGGGRRLVQDATGYDAIVVNGSLVGRHDQPTASLPGRLVTPAVAGLSNG